MRLFILLALLVFSGCRKKHPTASDPRYVVFKSHYYEASLAKTQLRGIDAPYRDTITVKYNPLVVMMPDTVRLSYIRKIGAIQ